MAGSPKKNVEQDRDLMTSIYKNVSEKGRSFLNSDEIQESLIVDT